MSTPRRWLITGASGQLGSDLVRELASRPDADRLTVMAASRADLDVTDSAAVRAALRDWRPDVVVNAAAHTGVDAAQSDEGGAFLANATAPGFVARAAAEAGARLVHVSTDYVFAGDAQSPYAEDDPAEPRTVYGRTKLAGEQAVLALHADAFVVRTAWLYGQTGGNFAKTMLRLAAERDTVQVVEDQRGSPTWSRHLARALAALAESTAAPGVYHCTNGGETSWFGFARAIFSEAGLDPERVLPTTSDALARPAPRPAYSVLSHEKWDAAGLPPMPDWTTGLREALPLLTGAGAAT